MLNVIVHARVSGLPAALIDDDAFIDAMWEALPDLGLGARDGVLSITLSQFALSRDRAAARQLERIRRALAAGGYPQGIVKIDEVVREGWRDDLRVIVSAARWHSARVLHRT